MTDQKIQLGHHQDPDTISTPTVAKQVRIFICHSHHNQAIAQQTEARLRQRDFSPWIDVDQVLGGEDIIEQIGSGLKTTDLLLYLISKQSLSSEWCKRELEFVTNREVKEKKILVLPVIIDETQLDGLPWFLQARNVLRAEPTSNVAEFVCEVVYKFAKKHFGDRDRNQAKLAQISRVPEIDQIIASVKLGDWKAAQLAAIQVLKHTNAAGENEVFTQLLNYFDLEDQEEKWKVVQTIESCMSISPHLCTRNVFHRMASHRDFSVRSSAASICMDLANFAPAHVPVDILIRLSVFDEDWYVQAPANAALKTLVSSMPGVLRLFFLRLESKNRDECAHSAAVLRDIASNEPELLNVEELQSQLVRLQTLVHREAIIHLEAAINDVRGAKPAKRYKYGL